ncbi:MAG: hypothetical protein R2831_11740 [Chitinophagaceae bacterium]
MHTDTKKHDTPTDANNVLAVVVNVFTNEFGDRIVNQGTFHDKRGYQKCYSITIDGKYIKSVGGVKTAKSFINEKRGVKCKWVGSVE